jgi:hypothetical protein
MTTIVDGLKYQQSLRAAGIEAEQATKLAEALSQAISTGDLATKADIAELRTEMAALKSSIIQWMIGTQLAFAAFLFAALKFTGHA